MPYFLSSKISFKCNVKKKDLAGVKSALAAGKPYVSIVHEDSRLNLWIFPKDCCVGSITISLEGNILAVAGDFTAKTKMSKSDMSDIEGASVKTWTTDGVSGLYPIQVDLISESESGNIEIDVRVSDKK